jgi:hypothetical protein
MTPDMRGPADTAEARLLDTYRDAMQNDRVLLEQFLTAWPTLSPAQRQTLYRTADLFASAARWKGGA